jgi:hypothetical protein
MTSATAALKPHSGNRKEGTMLNLLNCSGMSEINVGLKMEL